jgi:hypothetical protein
MRRGDFEDLVRRHLDTVLVPRGFTLTPQPPASSNDDHARAVFEAHPDDFNQRYPVLAAGGDAPCIDLWIELDPDTGKISATLEGPSVEEVADRLGLSRPTYSGPSPRDVSLQLADLGARLADVLDAAKGR